MMFLVLERANEIEKSNLDLFHKMRAIIRTKHTHWRQKLENPNLTANFAPRERDNKERAESAHNVSVSSSRSGSKRS